LCKPEKRLIFSIEIREIAEIDERNKREKGKVLE